MQTCALYVSQCQVSVITVGSFVLASIGWLQDWIWYMEIPGMLYVEGDLWQVRFEWLSLVWSSSANMRWIPGPSGFLFVAADVAFGVCLCSFKCSRSKRVVVLQRWVKGWRFGFLYKWLDLSGGWCFGVQLKFWIVHQPETCDPCLDDLRFSITDF